MIGTLNGVSADRVHVVGIEIDYTFKIYIINKINKEWWKFWRNFVFQTSR